MAANALSASQLGLQVTGQNLNNASTPGYTRSILQLTTDTSRNLGNGKVIGTGVQVAGVIQVIDQFLEERLRTATSDAMGSATQQKYFTQLENLLNATTGTDLSTTLLDFFNSIDNILNQPENLSYRSMAVELGVKLAGDINTLAKGIVDLQMDINKQVESSAEEINRLLKEIEELNTNITLIETKSGSTAVGLRDQRLVALTALSNLVGIKTHEDSQTGQVTIYSGSDILLSGGYRAEVKVGYTGGDNNTVPLAQLCIGKELTPLDVRGGAVYGLYQAHQTVLGGFLEQLDTFAEQLVTEFNNIYTSGQGLTGYTELTSLVRTDDVNKPIGTAGLETPVVNGGFFLQVYDTGTGATLEHYIEIKVDEASKSNPFSLKAPHASGGTTFQDLADAINAVPGLTATINAYGELEIKSEGGNVEFAFAQDTSGVLSALGLNTFFTGVRAGSLGINPTLLSDPSKFAASQRGVGADSEIGVFLAALAITPNSTLGGETLSNRYNGIVSETMVAGATMKAVASANILYQQSLQAQRDSISGVNVDEETIMMMTYQRMFQANSRFISIVDEMMAMLLSI